MDMETLKVLSVVIFGDKKTSYNEKLLWCSLSCKITLKAGETRTIAFSFLE